MGADTGHNISDRLGFVTPRVTPSSTYFQCTYSQSIYFADTLPETITDKTRWIVLNKHIRYSSGLRH
ncbi:hypothetical protein DSUL_60040 [Desulfovibrionales bacterium]